MPTSGLIPVHVEGTLATFSCWITKGKLGYARFLHFQPALSRAHAQLCEEPLPAPRAALELVPALTLLLSRTPRCSQRPRSRFHPLFLPFFLSVFSIFLPTPTPLRVWTLVCLSFSPPLWTSALFPDGPSPFPWFHLSFLLAFLRRSFPVFCAPQASQPDGKERAHRPQPRSPNPALISPSSSPKGASPEFPGSSPSSRPREPRWPPGGPSCQGRWVYFRSCIQCPHPEDAGTGPATRVTPLQHDPELRWTQFLQRVSDPLARQAAAPRLWMAVSKQASRNSSTQGTRARGRGVPAQATHCPPPRTRPPWHSHFSWHRDSQELSQPVPFTSVCPGLLNF